MSVTVAPVAGGVGLTVHRDATPGVGHTVLTPAEARAVVEDLLMLADSLEPSTAP